MYLRYLKSPRFLMFLKNRLRLLFLMYLHYLMYLRFRSNPRFLKLQKTHLNRLYLCFHLNLKFL